MQMLDREIEKCEALVVDSNPTSRSIIAAQLRDFGVATVVQCGRLQDARRALEHRQFDIVLCEQHFPGCPTSGQELLDELRREQLLPLSTVFVMITGEATYAKVAEAAEAALDSYLLKPHTATALGERLKQARHRKKVLKSIFEAVEAGDFETAAQLCLERFRTRGQYWLYAARIGAELLLRLGQHEAAKELYEAVIGAQALPWAKLGVARAQIEGGQNGPALRTLEGLISSDPSFVDAYDVMGRTHVENGQFTQALETYRQATALTPGSITRQQKLGMLAFYLGERAEAAQALERAAQLGMSSKMFDYQTMLLLAFARFGERDTKGLQRCVDNLAHALERAPQSARLSRFVRVARSLALMQARQVGAVVAEVKSLAEDISDERFDVEAACNMLSLVAELTAAELQLEPAEGWIERIALRFCTSRALSELLARAADVHPPHAERVREAQHRIGELAEQAMSHTLAGNARAAVKALIAHGGRTGNLKLIDTARLTLQRHHERISDAGELSGLVDDLRRRYAPSAGTPPLGQGQGRSAGGLTLRVSATCAPAAETVLRSAA
jgi:CheY-like chemotaxis protein